MKKRCVRVCWRGTGAYRYVYDGTKAATKNNQQCCSCSSWFVQHVNVPCVSSQQTVDSRQRARMAALAAFHVHNGGWQMRLCNYRHQCSCLAACESAGAAARQPGRAPPKVQLSPETARRRCTSCGCPCTRLQSWGAAAQSWAAAAWPAALPGPPPTAPGAPAAAGTA